jgi:hypothetical protein
MKAEPEVVTLPDAERLANVEPLALTLSRRLDELEVTVAALRSKLKKVRKRVRKLAGKAQLNGATP